MKYLDYITVFLAIIGSGESLSILSLNSSNINVKWSLENKNGSISIPGAVPGGVYSDLQRAGVIGPPLYRFNDVLTRWVAYDTWTYTAHFQVSLEELKHRVARLVLDGVDTVSFLELNNFSLGVTENMFVRYVFDVKEHLKEGQNTLKISFLSPVAAARIRSNKHFTVPNCVPEIYNGECHANQLRKMQASFAWDWGPAFPSVGLWRSASIEFSNGAILRSITNKITKTGHKWYLTLRGYLETDRRNAQISGHLRAVAAVNGDQTVEIAKETRTTTSNDGTAVVEIQLVFSEESVSTWWPNGYGEQPLYDVDLFYNTKEFSGEIDLKRIRVGFRTIEIIEEDASLVLGNTTAGKGLTFFFKINGHPLFMKGSNWIPAHILPELGADEETVDDLLKSAAESHMGMLRVWGGGVYESDFFYRRCDELGLLIWQDLLFACSMYPADKEFLDTVSVEVVQNVLRLQHHASIAVWAGNNENEVALSGNWYGTASQYQQYKSEYIKLYVQTIKPIVETLDPERRYLVSSPSNGRKSEEDGYVSENPYDAHYGDVHYYNYFNDNWDYSGYPKTRFMSEYGFQSFPSLSTMKTATKEKDDFRLDSEYSYHRQHSPNGNQYVLTEMQRHFKLNESDSDYFEKFVFYSQISQAMSYKIATETFRQSQSDWFTMGALYWQLNDVWQAPSWSSIEYGGKWKMVQYYAKTFFAPVLISPRTLSSGDVEVYILNDRFVPIIKANITVDVFDFRNLEPLRTKNYSSYTRALSAKKVTEIKDLPNLNQKEPIFLRFSMLADGVSTPYNYAFPKTFKDVTLKKPNIEIKVSNRTLRNKSGETLYTVEIEVDAIVLYLWLETEHYAGRFSDNGLIVTKAHTKLLYISRDDLKPAQLERAISYKYYYSD